MLMKRERRRKCDTLGVRLTVDRLHSVQIFGAIAPPVTVRERRQGRTRARSSARGPTLMRLRKTTSYCVDALLAPLQPLTQIIAPASYGSGRILAPYFGVKDWTIMLGKHR